MKTPTVFRFRIVMPAAALWLLAGAAVGPSAAQFGFWLPPGDYLTAKPVDVRLDSAPVLFDNVQPYEINGQVMIPVRAVMEQAGATVDWTPETQVVVAKKGDTEVQLTLGSQDALVNGRTVHLDTPVVCISDRAVVPMQFLGDALNVPVDWDSATHTVSLDTAQPPMYESPDATQPAMNEKSDSIQPAPDEGQDTVNSGPYAVPEAENQIGIAERVEQPVWPQIDSMTTSTFGDDNVVREGDEFHIVLHGTPGGQAQFRIRMSSGDIKMDETSPGVYEGSWRNETGQDVSVDSRDVIASIELNGNKTPEASAAEMVQ